MKKEINVGKPSSMNYSILEEEIVYKGFFTIKKAKISHDSFGEDTTVICSREVLDKGDCVAILLYEKDTERLIFINQFRYPTRRNGNGWLEEIPAGAVDDGEEPKMSVAREVREETGYIISDPEHIITFYATPGSSSERTILYFSEVSSHDKIFDGGGLSQEGEDIQLCKYPISKIDTLLQSSNDAKSIIALQWFKLNKM
ncbi:NUDIX domain-containing protein [Aquimarina pacifica]|uniref:NUDIX domain-containing protein n=1 Tax=Aquimarina pacifica TaxID=1296415 RepID=UPI0004B86D7C|nr:NUDIX hydrolase [Aquimarina pacifica]